MSENIGLAHSLTRGPGNRRKLKGVSILLIAGFVILLSTLFVENVSHGEIVVCESRFGGGAKVWEGWLIDDWRWQGLGKVTTYHTEARRKFRTEIDVGGTRFAVRGTATFFVFGDDKKILDIHRTYGSEDAIAERFVLPAIDAALRDVASDPAWPQSEWSSPDIRLRLQDELTRRLMYAPDPDGFDHERARPIPVWVNLESATAH